MITVTQTGNIMSIIIPYIHNDLNFINLKKILDFYSNFGNSEIIVVEQGKFKNLNGISQVIHKYILAEVNKYNIIEYNMGWLYNIGAQYATANILLLATTDMIINPNVLIQAVDSITKNADISALSCSTKNAQLDYNNSNLSLEQLLKSDLNQYAKYNLNIFNSLFLIKKQTFFDLSGWNESLIGDDLILYMHEIYSRYIKIGFIEGNYTIRFFNDFGLMYKQQIVHKSKETLQKILTLLKNNNEQQLNSYIKTQKEIGIKNKYV